MTAASSTADGLGGEEGAPEDEGSAEDLSADSEATEGEEAGDTEGEASTEEEPDSEQAGPEAEAERTGDEPLPAEASEVEDVADDVAEETGDAVEAEPEESQPAVSPAPGPEPTPGVDVLPLEANAELVHAHLHRCEKSLGGTARYDPAKRALADAHRAFSYLDAQRPVSVLLQALDHINVRIREEDAIGARRALRVAEDQVADSEIADMVEEEVEELADVLKDGDFESAAEAIQELHTLVLESTESEGRKVQAIRQGLVQAQIAIIRHAPRVAIAEIKGIRTNIRKLTQTEEPEETEAEAAE